MPLPAGEGVSSLRSFSLRLQKTHVECSSRRPSLLPLDQNPVAKMCQARWIAFPLQQPIITPLLISSLQHRFLVAHVQKIYRGRQETLTS